MTINRKARTSRRARLVSSARRGFSLVELLISLTVSLVILSSATAFALTSWQTRRGWTVREAIDRNARFIGMSLSRDAQEAGIEIESTPVFASVSAYGDTLSILSVPFEPTESPTYTIFNDGGASPTYPPGGNCGATCIEFNKVGGTYVLQAGDFARLQVDGERRLLFITSVVDNGAKFRVNFKNQDWMFARKSALSDSLLLSRTGSSIQKLKVTLFFWNSSTKTLMRADKFNTSTGDPLGAVLANNVVVFDPTLIFQGQKEYQTYDGFDTDTLNNGNKIIGIKVRAQLQSDHTDPAVNNGQPILRWYEWRVAPRNLLYEKNRTA